MFLDGHLERNQSEIEKPEYQKRPRLNRSLPWGFIDLIKSGLSG